MLPGRVELAEHVPLDLLEPLFKGVHSSIELRLQLCCIETLIGLSPPEHLRHVVSVQLFRKVRCDLLEPGSIDLGVHSFEDTLQVAQIDLFVDHLVKVSLVDLSVQSLSD